MSSAPALQRLTLAAVRVGMMVDFYNTVFGASLAPASGYDEFDNPLYEGTLGGVTFVVCPNDIAGVRAEQSRLQLHFTVNDLGNTLARVEEMNGAVLEEIRDEDGVRIVTVRDPDNNTLVLTGK